MRKNIYRTLYVVTGIPLCVLLLMMGTNILKGFNEQILDTIIIALTFSFVITRTIDMTTRQSLPQSFYIMGLYYVLIIAEVFMLFFFKSKIGGLFLLVGLYLNIIILIIMSLLKVKYRMATTHFESIFSAILAILLFSFNLRIDYVNEGQWWLYSLYFSPLIFIPSLFIFQKLFSRIDYFKRKSELIAFYIILLFGSYFMSALTISMVNHVTASFDENITVSVVDKKIKAGAYTLTSYDLYYYIGEEERMISVSKERYEKMLVGDSIIISKYTGVWGLSYYTFKESFNLNET